MPNAANAAVSSIVVWHTWSKPRETFVEAIVLLNMFALRYTSQVQSAGFSTRFSLSFRHRMSSVRQVSGAMTIKETSDCGTFYLDRCTVYSLSSAVNFSRNVY